MWVRQKSTEPSKLVKHKCGYLPLISRRKLTFSKMGLFVSSSIKKLDATRNNSLYNFVFTSQLDFEPRNKRNHALLVQILSTNPSFQA